MSGGKIVETMAMGGARQLATERADWERFLWGRLPEAGVQRDSDRREPSEE